MTSNPSQRFDGLLVGSLFTVGSELLRLTFIPAGFSLFQAMLVQGIVAAFQQEKGSRNVGYTIATVLSVIMVFVISWCLYQIWRRRYKDRKAMRFDIIIGMSVLFFAVHSLGVYIFWVTHLDHGDDGGLLFGVMNSFAYSSLAFLPIGLVIDMLLRFKVNQ